jgi:PAS domain S-box-containing protein
LSLIPKLQIELKEVNFQLVQTIADQQMSEDRLNLQLTRLKLMYDLVSALNLAQSIIEISQIALDGICAALGISQASIVTINLANALSYQTSVGISQSSRKLIADFWQDLNPQIASEFSSFPNSAKYPRDRHLQNICETENIGALAAFPLEYERRHLGNIVAYFDTARQLNEEEIQLVRTIISYIAIALTRKETEIALKESQQFIQTITDTSPNILYIYDLEQQCNTYCNQAITHVLGYRPSEIQAMGRLVLNKIIHPDDLARVRIQHELIRNSRSDSNPEKLFEIEYRMRDIYGKWKWFHSQETVFSCNAKGEVKQIIGATSDISKLKEVENRLQSSLLEKEVLIREVHHRVKNNLNVVDSLLSMQTRYITDEQALKAISDSQRRIHTMSLIHEQLYQSSDVHKIDFAEYIQRLVTNFDSSANFNCNQIKLKLDLKPALLNIDMAISIGLIVNELLTNSFKHAFPDQSIGLIEVILYQDENNSRNNPEENPEENQDLHLIIRDNGVGILQNIDFYETNSLGLRLVRILTQQLRANLDLSCDVGTSFHFSFSEFGSEN